MYLRAAHAETSLRPLINFIRENPLGILTTAIHSETHPFIQHTYLPWVLYPPTNVDLLEASGQADRPPIGNLKQPVHGLENCKLRGHLARANPHAKALIEAAAATSDGRLSNEVTVSFTSPAQSYITPKFYVSTKPETGKVVPTWNYTAVEVRGFAKIFHDSKSAETSDYLQRQIEELTQLAEAGNEKGFGHDKIEGSIEGNYWEVSDAPKSYIDILKKAIIGIEIEVTSIVGRFKMSQELKEGDRKGVKEGLRQKGDERSGWVADIVESRSNDG